MCAFMVGCRVIFTFYLMRKLHISQQGFKDVAASQMNVTWDFIEFSL